MSFDLAGEQINQRVASLPLTSTIEPGAFDNFARGTGMAAMRTQAAAASGIDLLGSVGPIVQDLLSGGGTKRQDQYFAEHDAIFKRATDYWTPKPGEVGMAGEIAGTLLGTLPMVLASPAAAVSGFQMSQAESFVNAGAGAGRANIAAMGMGAGFAAGIWMPILGQNLWQRMLVGGAGSNVAQGILTRGFAGQLLEGHVQEGAAPTAFNLQDITTDALLGLAFGSFAHVSPEQRAQGAKAWTQIRNWAEKFSPSEVDALAVLRLGQHKNADSAPGIPHTPADLQAHVDRMNESIRALVHDEPVNVEGIGKEVVPEAVDNSPAPTDATAPSVEDIHSLADENGLKWDNDPAFMDLTEEVTGKRHLDELDATERTELARHIAGEVTPPQTAQNGPESTITEPPTFDPRPDRERDATAIVDNLKAAASQIAKDYDLPEALQPIEEHPVYQSVRDQLKPLADRVTPEQADAYARLHTAFYNAMATRTGRTVDDLLAAHPVKVTGAAPPVGALEQAGGPIFYSLLERHLTAAKMEAAPAKGWKDFIRGLQQKGVKPDEVKWSGIEDWLDAQGGKVSKGQVIEFLKSGGVKVDEVMAGGAARPADQPTVDRLRARGWEVDAAQDTGEIFRFINTENGGEIDAADAITGRWRIGDDEARLLMREVLIQQNGAPMTKFQQYQLPGGQNYRELLLTLPPTQMALEQWKIIRPDGHVDSTYASEESALIQAGHRGPGYRVERGEPKQLEGGFRSSHFDTPNILAHIRFNERTDAEGKKVLFVEEFQSDWAQQGKKKGFNDGSSQQRFDALKAEVEAKHGQELSAMRMRQDKSPEMATDLQRIDEAYAMAQADKHGAGVPAAPFVGKTDAWVALAVKRVIRYAAEHGFERVAWTTGEQQVERYSSALRKAVDSIEWEKTPEGIHITGYKGKEAPAPTDRQIREFFGLRENADPALYLNEYMERNPGPKKVVDTRQREDELSDAIGKSMAERIIKDPNQKGVIEGEAINISDTGMAGFYDRIVPKVVNEVLKKLGAGKVGAIDFPARFEVKEIDGVWVAQDEGGSGEQFDTRQQAEQWAADNNKTEDGKANIGKQTGFEITPEMRTAAMAGQPLFQDSTAGPRGYMATDEAGGRTIGLLAGADPSTMIHESAHFFLDTMNDLAAAKNAPAELRADMDRIMKWFGTTQEKWDGMDLEARRTFHEQFARGFELYTMEGRAPTPELRGIFQRFRDWLLDVYKTLTDLNVEVSDPIRAVFDRMLSGKRAEEAAGVRTTLGLDDPGMREQIRHMAYNEAGWAEVGGRILREGDNSSDFGTGVGGDGAVVGRSQWVPKAEWWRGRPDTKLNEDGYRKAVEKALAGEKLRPIEQRAIDYLLSVANDDLAAIEHVGGKEEYDALSADLRAEGEPITAANVVDAHEVALAMEVDEAGVERAALQHENDDAAFMAEVRRINETSQTGEGGEKGSGAAGRDGQDAGGGPESAGPGSEPPSALSVAAQSFVDSRPDLPLRVGTNADGSPLTMTARDYLDRARAAHEQAMQDAPLFEAAAQCLLGES